MEKSKKVRELEIIWMALDERKDYFLDQIYDFKDNEQMKAFYTEMLSELEEVLEKYDELLNLEYKRMDGWEV